MSTRTGMAAQFTSISLDEMTKFLGRAFHALRPQRQVNVRGEVAIELPLSDHVTITVFTSISHSGGQAAGVGADAIRVGLYRNQRPLTSGKLPIVKRTQNWKDNLRERIEDQIERFDMREEEIERGDFIHW